MDLPTEPRLWDELQAAALQRAHGWRTPVLATVATDGSPNARTVVLRSADPPARVLTCFTHARSPKVAELAARPQAMLVFWCPRLQWQLRVRARVMVEVLGPELEAAWARVRASSAARDYLSPEPPGAPWPVAQGQPAGPAAGEHHFAILRAEVSGLDWLGLSATGEHRRVVFEEGRAQARVP